MLRLSAAATLLLGLAVGAAEAQKPYRQSWIPGLSSFDVGFAAQPDLVDLDADGDLDIVVGAFYGRIYLFANSGNATAPAFAEAISNPLAEAPFVGYLNPDLVDLDGDGDLDAVVGMNDGALRYLVNTGTPATPTFVAATGVANPFVGLDVGAQSSPELADLDDDGDLDLVVGSLDDGFHYFVNTGSSVGPAFVEVHVLDSPFRFINVDRGTLELVDLDADGDLDAVVGEQYGTVLFYSNTGSQAAPVFLQRTGSANPFDDIDVGYGSSLELADLDGDGDLEALIGERFGSLRLFLNLGSPSAAAFQEPSGTANPLSGGIDVDTHSAPTFADLDADGDLDVLIGNFLGAVRYLRNTATSASPSYLEATGTANPFNGIDVGSDSHPEISDLDRDGDFDVLLGSYAGTLRYFANTGTSVTPAYLEQTGTLNPIAGIDVGIRSAPDLMDIDADGDFDAVVGTETGNLFFYRNTGSATALAFGDAGTSDPFIWIDAGSRAAPDLIDVDGDGDLDLAVGHYGRTLLYYANVGTPTTASFLEITGESSPFTELELDSCGSPFLVDLDGDGDIEVIAGEVGGRLVVFKSLFVETIFANGFESGDIAAWQRFHQ